MKCWGFLLLLAILVCLAASAVAQPVGPERILSFRSDITVHQDSSMTVTETINVVATGVEIKRGIYREFPTRYKDRFGHRYVVGFEVSQVLKNGEPEPYHVEDYANGKRLYIGDADVYLTSGEYSYSITYKTNRQLGFFKDHDELYWNVTGNGWDFSIEDATAVVTLPEAVRADAITVEAYTGPEGSTARDYVASVGVDGRAGFRATKRFGPKEGLTIVVSWPKGFVQEPTWSDRAGYFLRDNSSILVAFLGLVAIVIVYVIMWARVGNDPPKGTIIPEFEPPDGLSPAAVRFISRMGFDYKAFAAAVINMAVKGYVKIEQAKGTHMIRLAHAGRSALSSEEADIADILLVSNGSFEFKDTHHAMVQTARLMVQNSLDARYSRFFSKNTGYFAIGVAISIVVLVAALVVHIVTGGSEAAFLGVWLTLWTFGVAAILTGVVHSWRSLATFGSTSPGGCAGAGCMTIFAIPFVGAEIGALYVMFAEGAGPLVLIAVVIGAINYLFFHLLRNTTLEGRRLLDKIEGFKMYLSIAEEDRLNTLNPPEKTPQLFEKYMPYALALDVEQQWAEKFADVLAKSAVGGEGSYTPSWYSGSAWRGMADPTFFSTVGSSMSSAIAASSTPPGSSSGSSGGFSGGGGGGGSSGGGGGGGGGGGW